MKRIVRRPKAEQDLGDIFDWIADTSISNANRYIERIVATISRLAEIPNIGSHRLPSYPDIRSFPIGNHHIFYRPISDGIEVVRIIHVARDWANDDEIL
jgi:toxin ParE1/3/4